MTTNSLIMTTHNGQAHLAEQLASLEAQTVRPSEAIIGDDGSTDATLDLLEAFATRVDFPVRLRRNPARVGYARNFADCTRSASGDILLFVDQDDIWHPDKIATVIDRMEAGCHDVSLHDLTVFFEDSRPVIPSYHRHLHDCGFTSAVCYKGCTMAVRKTFVDLWGWPPEGSGISHDFWLAALGFGAGRALLIEECLIHHRIHARNTSGWVIDANTRKPKAWHGSRPSDLQGIVDMSINAWNVAWLDVLEDRIKAPPGEAGDLLCLQEAILARRRAVQTWRGRLKAALRW